MTDDAAFKAISRRLLLNAFVATGSASLSAAAFGQGASGGTTKLIVPYATGGTADLVARAAGDRITQKLGAPVVPDYRPGGNLVIGAQAAAAAPPDGRTLFLGTGTSQCLNPLLRSDLPYRADQFAPVAMLTENSYLFVVPPSSPARSLKEFVDYARQKPGQLNYGSFGVGNITHLGTEWLCQMAGISMQNVPYRAGTQADLDLLGGRLDFLMTTFSILPHVKSGAARALAVSMPERFALLAETPTVAEQGYPDYDVRGWFALFAPTGTPAPLLKSLNEACNLAMADASVREAFAPQGLVPVGGAPDLLAKQIAAENARWAPIIERLGLRDKA